MATREEFHQQGEHILRQLQHPLVSNTDTTASRSAPGATRLVTEVVFGAVWARPGLGLQDRMVCTLSVLSVLQRLPQLSTYLNSALDIGMAPRTLQEVIIQGALYAGFPTMVNSLRLARDVFEACNMVVPDTPIPDASLEELDVKGREMMQTLHGERSQSGYAAPDSPVTSALYDVAIQYGYGDIWQRPDLDTRQRAICAVASFTALNLVTQLEKFLQAALNVGLSKDEVIEVLVQTAPYSGFPKALNALALAEKVLG